MRVGNWVTFKGYDICKNYGGWVICNGYDRNIYRSLESAKNAVRQGVDRSTVKSKPHTIGTMTTDQMIHSFRVYD